MKTILYNPIFINPQAYYVFPRLTRWLRPDNGYKEPANYIGQIEVTIIAYGEIGYTEYFEHTNYIDFTNFSNSYVRISLFTRLGSCVLGEWKIGAMESDRPYIEPEVLASLKAVVIVGDKTNQDKDRDTVANLVDASNPFVISNAAYDKMSSYGGYEFAKFDNTLDWYNTEGNDSVEVVSRNGHSITLKRLTGPNFWYFQNSTFRGLISNVIPFKVNSNKNITVVWDVHGLSISEGKDKSVRVQELVLNPNEDNYTNLKTLNEEELAQIDISTNSLYYLLWFDLSTLAVDEEVTIEMLPLFEGAFVTDGIDDLITSTKTLAEMGITDEVTVVSMIHQIALNTKYNLATTNYIENLDNGKHIRSDVYSAGKTGIYGYSSSLINNNTNDIKNILGDRIDYATKTDNASQVLSNGKFSVVGRARNHYEASSIAWYWTIIANKVLTTDQINQVIAYFNLDRTLNPDILCNTIKQGITNENHAEFGDKLIDYSGNGRDIQLNNIAWKGDSGIGKYETELSNTSIWTQSKETTSSPFSSSYNGLSGWIIFANTELTNSVDMPSFKIQVKGLLEGQELIYRYYDSNGQSNVYSITKDGDYTLPSDFRTAKPQISNTSGFQVVKNEANIITITQIPSHAGALCLDGVNDFGKVTGMPIYKDYTFIIDYERISYTSERWGGAIVSKAPNANNGAFISMMANSAGLNKQLFSFGGVTTFIKDDLSRILFWQTKYKSENTELTVGEGVDGDTLWLGTLRDNDSRFFNGAIYSLMSFPYSMSEFLIERQLKKYKLGTLYPDMVEFRPVIKKDDRIKSIKYYIDGKIANIGQYYPIGSGLGIAVETVQPYVINTLKFNGKNTIPNASHTGFNTTLDSKSPQKITMDIQVDSSLVQWNPVVESNIEYSSISYLLRIPGQGTVTPVSGQYYPILSTDTSLVIYVATKGVDEVANLTVNGQEPTSSSIHVDGRFKFEFPFNNSPQKINITIDEYIRYEDIVQPYPLFFEFTDENGNLISWGGKAKVGSTITRTKPVANANLLAGMYNTSSYKLNEKPLEGNSYVVEKQMIFTCTATWAFDDNEPNCILSPRLLRIPNSSYKILGHIPDISGHGNNGVINNSAYAEGSGVNEDGSYQFDGVDDFITIPTLSSGGKQVLMKVNWDSSNSALLYDQRGYNNEFAIYNGSADSDGNPIPAYNGRNNGQTYIDGILNSNIKASELRAITHNITITNELSAGVNKFSPVIGSNRVHNAYFTNMALYDFMLFDNISTDDKIKQLNEYVGIEGNTE